MQKKPSALKTPILLTAGNLILAFAVSYFILPNNILSGGVAGVAVALHPILNVDVRLLINMIIVITFILGYLFMGKKFALKTVASSIMYPIFIELFSHLPEPSAIEPILASLFGGALCGVGLALTFQTGASTGGMDIPPLILEKYTRVKVSVWILLVDAVTVLLGLRSYSLNDVLIGLLSVYAATMVMEKIAIIGGQQARQISIISDYNDLILEQLHLEIERGSTLLSARGGYTRDKKEVIMTVVTRSQYYELEKIVLEIDPDAFLIVSTVTEVHGLGFRKV